MFDLYLTQYSPPKLIRSCDTLAQAVAHGMAADTEFKVEHNGITIGEAKRDGDLMWQEQANAS